MLPAPDRSSGVHLESPRVGSRHLGLGRWIRLASLLVALLPILLALAAGLVHAITGAAILVFDGILGLAATGMFAALIGMFLDVVVTSAPLRSPRLALLQATAAGLRVVRRGRTRDIARARIEDGLILPGYPPRVEIRLAGGEVIDAEVPSERHGLRLLAALGIGPEQRRVAVPLWSASNPVGAGIAAVPLAMLGWAIALSSMLESARLGGVAAALWMLGVVLTVALVMRAARPTRVVVGRDGVRLERPFSTRWIPYATLEEVDARGSQLRLRARGATRALRVSGRPDLVDLVAQRVREAQARGAGIGASGTAALERQGRPIPVWRDAVRGLLAAESGYRSVALTPEDLILALEDPVAPRDRRIGAALALAATDHPEARVRIRIAAETSADEEMRAALEQAAEEALDEATLEKALREAPAGIKA